MNKFPEKIVFRNLFSDESRHATAALKNQGIKARSSKPCLVYFICLFLCIPGQAQNSPNVIWQSTSTNGLSTSRVAISPNGKVAATMGSNYTIQIWSMSNGIPLVALPAYDWVRDLAFSPNGLYLASGGGDRVFRVWRTTNWSYAYGLSTTNQGPPLAFSPDSATLAIGNGTAIELRRATNGALIQSWTATSGQEMAALAFSPDGSKLASGAGARGVDTSLKLWSVPSGSLLRTVQTAQTYSVGRIVFSPDGLQVLTGSRYLRNGKMEAWRVSDGTLLRTFPLDAYAMSFSPDGSILAAVGTNIMIFHASDGSLIIEYPDGISYPSGNKELEISPVGGLFVLSRTLGRVLAARLPVQLSTPSIQGGQMTLRWVGGSGRYQLQGASNLGGGWQNIGGTMNTNVTYITPNTSNAFFEFWI